MLKPQIKILLVDEMEQRGEMLLQVLGDCGYDDVVLTTNTRQVLDQVRSINPDIILIDVASPTRDTLEQLTLIRDKQPRPVVLFTQDQNVQSIQAAIHSGVSAYVTDGIGADKVQPAIAVAMATFRAFQSLRDQLEEARSNLDHQKSIQKAKGIVMSRHKLSEPDAYRFLQKFAMNRKRKLIDVAKDVIAMEELTPS